MPDEVRSRPLCLQAALDYERRGFSVILLHGIQGGLCTCGKPGCLSPGKHSIGKWKHAQERRATAAELQAAFASHPDANVGIVTGAISGLVVIDLDGQAGMASCERVMAGQEPPKLPTVRTGSGYHLYGRHPGTPLKNVVKNHPGLDGRADGGYVVAPPSRHASGRVYELTRQLEKELPELPPELLALFV
jgi:putative DNA primase/helicase